MSTIATVEESITPLNFEDVIKPYLSETDDVDLWGKVFEDLSEEFELLRIDQNDGHKVFLEIGSCSHWLRPHQTRLTAAGGFAAPSGSA